jgi:hypothetical protein
MTNLERLIEKTVNSDFRLQIRFDSEDISEQWSIKIYPEKEGDGHFYAFHENLEDAARLLLNELQDAKKW